MIKLTFAFVFSSIFNFMNNTLILLVSYEIQLHFFKHCSKKKEHKNQKTHQSSLNSERNMTLDTTNQLYLS